MRPEYLNHLFLVGLVSYRSVLYRGRPIGSVSRVTAAVEAAGSYWRFQEGGKAYPTARAAAEALAVTHFDGPVACATFDAERIKEQAK